MSAIKRAYSYIRISTPEQARGDGMCRQIRDADAWAGANGYVIDQRIQDVGVSAFKGLNRSEGALAKFLALVENGTIEKGSALIIESLDRLSRESVVQSLPDFLALLRAGIVIVTLHDGQTYSWESLKDNPTPLYASLGVMHRAHEESAIKSVRVGKAWTQKRQRARETGEVLTARVPAWIEVVVEGKQRRFALVEERAKVVRRIFNETVAGYGRRSIVIRLNEQKVPTFSGKGSWQPSYIAKIVRSRAAIGEHRPRPRNADAIERPIENYFPAVVPKALFNKANTALDARTKGAAGPRGPGVANLLQGVVFCGSCGARMSLVNKGAPPKGGRYLVCSDAARAAGCEHDRHWRLDLVERVVVGRVDSMAIAAALDLDGEPNGPTERDLERGIATLNERIDSLIDLAETGSARVKQRLAERERELADLERQLSELREANGRVRSLPSLEERVRAMRELWDRMGGDAETREQVRRALAQHIREIWKCIRLNPRQILGVLDGFHSPGMPRRPPRSVDGKVATERTLVLYDDSPDRAAEEAWQHPDDDAPPTAADRANLERLLSRSRTKRAGIGAVRRL